LGALGMIVMVQRCGTLDLHSRTDRTWPMIVDPAARTVAVLPLNWAMRKRRTSFWSVVSNVHGPSSVHATIVAYRRTIAGIVDVLEPELPRWRPDAG
jgi:hypothetical protein